MLTAEWIDGYKITDLDSIKKDNFDIADIDKKLFKIFSEQIFNTGFVHAGFITNLTLQQIINIMTLCLMCTLRSPPWKW